MTQTRPFKASAFVAGALLLGSVLGLAQKTLAADRTAQVSYNTGSHVLKLVLEDSKASSNACDYHVERFEYIPSLQSVLMTLNEETCLVDRYGKKKAVHYWVPPRSLRTGGQVCLIVNGQRLGSIQIGPEVTNPSGLTSEKCE